ncbi:hypothetical protein [Bdellovibrio sp. NC01]|uniref:hypothetical protein n=1 Tax=Bdellovibrio sp. NC01 TaxID=2220073 RepID=UPI00115BB51E|nr:hypothetical protein [Bdellovibrio sp. NC01]QDK36572.1 hypothetical protein DOE51_02635 [Bdellovibrio sp. NC01]
MKMSKVILALACTLSLESLAVAKQVDNSEAASCGTIDVRDGMQGDLKKHFQTPVNQGSVGWCYGYAASDVLSQKVGQPVSAVHTSAYYQTQIGTLGRWGRSILYGADGETTGGFIGAALDEMKELGMACTTRGVTSQGVFPYELTPGYVSRGDTAFFIDGISKIQNNTCDSYCEQKMSYMVKHFTPNLTMSQLISYVRSNSQLKIDQLLFNIVDASCGNNKVRVYPWLKVQSGVEQPQPNTKNYVGIDETRTFIYKLNKALERGKVVGLEYNAKYITEVGGVFGGFHASTVIGRKMINGQCYYNVRNSWGKTCSYKPGIICSPDDGSYWVQKDTMRLMSTKIVYVD